MSLFLIAVFASLVTAVVIGMSFERALLTGLVFGSVAAAAVFILGATGRIDQSVLKRTGLKINPLPDKRAVAGGIVTVAAAGVAAGVFWEFSVVAWLLWIPTAVVLGVLLAWALNRAHE